MPADAKLCTNDPTAKRMKWCGMNGIYNFCRAIDAGATDAVTEGSREYLAAALKDVVFRLLVEVVKPSLASSMPPADQLISIKRNAMYEVRDPDDHRMLLDAVNKLKHCVRFDEAQNQVSYGSDSTGTLVAVTHALQEIEAAKVGTLARAARNALASPSTKVVIAVNYTKSVKALTDALAEHEPLLLTGKSTQAQRVDALERFQAADTSSRLLICNLRVSNAGIDLDDKHGGFPRVVFANANFSAIDQFQFAGRATRRDSKSVAVVNFVFGKHATEQPVLDAIRKKNETMRAVVSEQAAQLADIPMVDADLEREQAEAEARAQAQGMA